MTKNAESVMSYVLGLGFALYSGVLAHANEVMTIGGLVLLAARLYVDVGRAYKVWRANRGSSNRR